MTVDRDDRPPFATLLCLARGPLAPPYEQAAVGRTDAPLDPAATYKVATNDFVRRGGDGYLRACWDGDLGGKAEDSVFVVLRKDGIKQTPK